MLKKYVFFFLILVISVSCLAKGSLILGLASHTTREGKKIYPGYKDLSLLKNLYTFGAFLKEEEKEIRSFKEIDRIVGNQIMIAVSRARTIYFNCTGVLPEKFQVSSFESRADSYTNKELSYLFSCDHKKIKWILEPESKDWLSLKSKKNQMRSWWQNKRETQSFCHANIFKALKEVHIKN